mmetsp:Transcript_19760/g.58617  ORF Transcript_19760/g.58617 Transcript_19760/m.58617 type:complete len:244 (-) Transcript_19760:1080-1811(-)
MLCIVSLLWQCLWLQPHLCKLWPPLRRALDEPHVPHGHTPRSATTCKQVASLPAERRSKHSAHLQVLRRDHRRLVVPHIPQLNALVSRARRQQPWNSGAEAECARGGIMRSQPEDRSGACVERTHTCPRSERIHQQHVDASIKGGAKHGRGYEAWKGWCKAWKGVRSIAAGVKNGRGCKAWSSGIGGPTHSTLRSRTATPAQPNKVAHSAAHVPLHAAPALVSMCIAHVSPRHGHAPAPLRAS